MWSPRSGRRPSTRSTRGAVRAPTKASSQMLGGCHAHRQARRFLDGLEHDRGARRADSGDPAETVPEQLTDVFRVAGPDLEQVTVVAGHMVQLEDFRALRQRVRDAVVAGRLLAADGDERQHGLLELPRIDQGRVALDDPTAFQLPDTLQDSRRGQTDNPGDVGLRYSGVFLQKIQYCGVCFVNHSVLGYLYRIYIIHSVVNPNVPLVSLAPPSTVRTSPVMNPDCGDARNATASATSPGVPHRRSGTVLVMRSTASGVLQSCRAAPGDSIGPGATALTRMP